jgi:flavin-dependent dehydrogenase
MDRAGDHETALTADLVVDATGRASRTPLFLEQLGYGRPAEDELMVQLAYACQLLRIAPDAVKEHMIALFPEPGRPKMFGFTKYENDTCMVGVGTMAGAEPPHESAELLQFAASNGRAFGRGGSPSSSVQPLAALRQDAPNAQGSARRRRRGVQLQSHLWARHDGRGDRGDGAA